MASTLPLATTRHLRVRGRAVVAVVGTFALWTVLVWGGRIRNVASADDLGATERAWRLALAVGFVAGGLAVGALLWAARGRVRAVEGVVGAERVEVPDALRRAVTALALVTTAVWVVRGTTIVLGEYGTGFKVVHSVLAVGSVALAAAAWSAVGPRSTGPQRRR